MAWTLGPGGTFTYSGPSSGSGIPTSPGGTITGGAAETLGVASGTRSAGGSAFPTSVPAGMVANPYITPVSANTPGASPMAGGFELLNAMLQNIFNAERLRQSAIDQQVSIATLLAQTERASPTQAADLAVQLGMPGRQPNLGFANSFVNADTTGVFGGTAGTQSLRLPFAFSGKELTFLGQNRNLSSVISDIAARFGKPDLLSTSAASLIPTNSALIPA